MRWQELFADLETQFAAAERAEIEEDVAERTRVERGTIELASRLLTQGSASVTVHLRGGRIVSGTVGDVGASWLLLLDAEQQFLLPLEAIAAIGTLSPRSAPMSPVLRKLSLGHVLRGLARDRATVLVDTLAGQWRGRVDAVFADHFELALAQDALSITFSALICVAAL